ncbi:MAG: UTRA domain-containing protein [Proteobacteria bacterium]|nr:UTRA domain-containing protein [Pseudomonadota bacterium]
MSQQVFAQAAGREPEAEFITKDKPDLLYERAQEHIVAGIRSGKWRAGDRLPSELQIVKELGISKMTVNKAFRQLALQGLINRVPARGSFVANPREQSLLFELRDFSDDIRAQGGRYSCQILALELMRMPRELADYDLRTNTEVFHSPIIHERDGIPVQIEERWVNPSVFPDYLSMDFRQTSTFRYLLRVPPTEMEHEISAVSPTEQEQALLRINPMEPCLRLSRRTWFDRELLARSRLTSPGSRYAIENRFKVARTMPS